jgi:maltose O-acetyltransferase
MRDFIYLVRNRCPFNEGGAIKRFLKRVYYFPSLIRIFCHVGIVRVLGAEIGDLVVIENCRINGSKKNLSIGSRSSIVRAELSLHDKLIIGSNVVLNSGVRIITASHDINDPEWPHVKNSVIIEDYAWIATGAMVLPGSRIGKGAVVGAGAVVKGNVPDYSIIIGNPGRILDKRRNQDLRYSPVNGVSQFEAWLG